MLHSFWATLYINGGNTCQNYIEITNNLPLVICPTLINGSKWQIIEIWEGDVFRLDLAYTLRPIRVLSRNTHPAERQSSQDIMILHRCQCICMTDTFCSNTRNVIFKSCFLLSEYGSNPLHSSDLNHSLESGFHYFERAFPLRNEVIRNYDSQKRGFPLPRPYVLNPTVTTCIVIQVSGKNPTCIYRVSQKKKETRFISEMFSLSPRFSSKYICFMFKGIFPSFIWYQTHDDISMHDWKGTIWTHTCQNRVAQNNGVELIWPSSD